jgi:hypothetical protein
MEEYHESKLAVLEREVEKFKAEIKDKRNRWERLKQARKDMGIPPRKRGRPQHRFHIC